MDDLFTAEELDQELLEKEAAARQMQRKEEKKEDGKSSMAPLTGKKLYIVDGYSLIYRSYFAFLTHPLTDSENNNVSAFFGFFNTIFMLIKDYSFDYFVIAMDSKGPTFRHEMYSEYKANRDAAPQDLHSQVPLIMNALEKLNIPYIAKEGYEADDLIATLASNASRLGIETVMVTGDKDLLQLVSDRVKALRPPKKNQPKYTLFGADEVFQEFGIRPAQIIDYLSLLGDSSDNVPGVRGIGEKGAVKLLEEYVSLDGIYRHLDSLSKGLRTKLEEGRESAMLSRTLVTLKDDVFTLDTFDKPDFLTSTIDYASAVDIFKAHNCYSLAKTASSLARKENQEVSEHEEPAIPAIPCDVLASKELLGLGEDKKSVVTGVEMFRKILDEGEAGDNVGLLLRGIEKTEVKRGMVITHPGAITPHSKFKASIYVLKKEEGGRHTPFGNKYRPQFYLRTMDCTGEISLPEGTEMVMPGDNVEITVELIYPVALNVGLRFAIREGGRTVGSGQITEVLD